MKHLYIEGKNTTTFLLLHGTGGTENDLIPIAKYIDQDANVLSVRGNILENGMSRFFKRIAFGVFDIDNLMEETKNLFTFLIDSSKKYKFDKHKVIALGYSNGANIALSTIFQNEKAFQSAILFHPMIPLKNYQLVNLDEMQIFIGSGNNDPMVSNEESLELCELLINHGANTKIYWTQKGHQLNQEEVEEAKIWYKKNKETR